MNKFDCIVVGGGISGLLSALVLSKEGKSVLVLERDKKLGNNCSSYDVDGYQVDTGPHAITQLGKGGPLSYLMEKYFDNIPVFVDYGEYLIRSETGLKKVPTTLCGYLTMEILPVRDRLIIAQALIKMIINLQLGSDLSKTPVYQCLPWENLSQDTADFIDTFCYFLSGKSMKETSVQRLLVGGGFIKESIKEEMRNENTQSLFNDIKNTSYISRLINNNKVSHNQFYPKDGLKAIVDAILFSLPGSVKIKTDTAVREIYTDGNRAKGVLTDENSYYADTIIYSAFVKDLPNYIKDLPVEYISNLKNVSQSRTLTIWLGISDEFNDFNYIGGEVWFKKKPFWAMPISNYNKNLAPEGKKLVGFMFSVHDAGDIESEKRHAYDAILNVYPGIEKYIEMVHYQLTMPEKASVTIDGFISDTKTPILNLYVVGTDADERSMGVTRAAYSVVKLINVLKKDGVISNNVNTLN